LEDVGDTKDDKGEKVLEVFKFLLINFFFFKILILDKAEKEFFLNKNKFLFLFNLFIKRFFFFTQ